MQACESSHSTDEDDLRECVRPLAKGLGANISARFSAAAAAFARFCAHGRRGYCVMNAETVISMPWTLCHASCHS
jgi:hypothetical protein